MTVALAVGTFSSELLFQSRFKSVTSVFFSLSTYSILSCLRVYTNYAYTERGAAMKS